MWKFIHPGFHYLFELTDFNTIWKPRDFISNENGAGDHSGVQ